MTRLAIFVDGLVRKSECVQVMRVVSLSQKQQGGLYALEHHHDLALAAVTANIWRGPGPGASGGEPQPMTAHNNVNSVNGMPYVT
jgi:hypothetical protein